MTTARQVALPIAAVASGATASALAALDAIGTVVSLRRHEVLFREGDPAIHYYKVVSGAVRTHHLMSNGRRHVVDFSLQRDLIGLNALASHNCTAESIGESTLVRYERGRVEMLMSNNPKLAQCLMEKLRAELSAAQQRILLLGRMSASERLAAFLLAMAGRGSSGDPARISLPMTRSDIGDYLGLTTETVCREIAALKNLGAIAAPGPHDLRMLRSDLLQEIVGRT